ncbi:sulfotransferase family protein [Thermomonospora umbrina]|uniref:Sulfotransferase family protein n=1 Tax=Thermomonospora umbrina TaxID=111806 RepID=A0A3D9SZH3_9ACTN|nr:sulfotransferase family protein [Thermomonospora umbrina]REE97974.1 hypothetical protein DFJ69_3454 [Thermomonospora umbrina]
MLHVIGAGFPRTGTSSTKAALERLGFGPCHHMFELMSHPEQVERWLSILEPGPNDWDRILQGYRSSVDWPSAFFWRELADAYPDAKVVLTIRDPERWYASMRDTIFKANVAPLPEGEHPHLSTMRAIRPTLLNMIWLKTYGTGTGTVPTKEQAITAFERHIVEVRETLPADRLLVFEAREGWGPLCDFLGVPVPDDPFPHLNDGDAMRVLLTDMAEGRPVTTPFDASAQEARG